MTTCKCGYPLSTIACPDCNEKLSALAFPPPRVPPRYIRDKAAKEEGRILLPDDLPESWGRGSYQGPPMDEEHRQWLLQFEQAVLSKVVASLMVRYNGLSIGGFLVESDPAKQLERMFVVKLNLNGRERAIKIALYEHDDRQAIQEKVRATVAKFVTEEILRLMDAEWQEGGFRKLPQ